MADGQKLQVQLHGEDPKREWVWIGGFTGKEKGFTPDFTLVLVSAEEKGKKVSLYIEDRRRIVRIRRA